MPNTMTIKNTKNTGKQKKLFHKSLLFWEIKKLCTMPMFPVFLLLCILFNILLTAGNYYNSGYVDYVKEAGKTTGNRMGREFDARLKKLPRSDYRDILSEETKNKTDIFEHYHTSETAQLYINTLQISGWTADMLEQKYEKLQPCVSALASQDASMDVGAAGMTKDLLDTLFRRLCAAVITEGMITAVLMALYICGSEQLHRTMPTVYTSRRGRQTQREKLAAGALCAIAAYGSIAALSCAVYAGIWQLGDIWQTNMSTQFYYLNLFSFQMPFISWKPFTVQTYLAAVLLLGAAVVLLFYGLGYFCGLITKNSYGGFLLLFTVSALNFWLLLLAVNSSRWMLYEISLWSPAALWWFSPLWFTDMGVHALLPWQECLTALFCLTGTGIFLLFGFRRFYHKDLG